MTMPPDKRSRVPSNIESNSKKRKQYPSTTAENTKPNKRSKSNQPSTPNSYANTTTNPTNKTKIAPQRKQRSVNVRDARTIRTQTSTKTLQNGALDVDKFVKAREFEIRALEDGLVRSKKALTQRAFQQVPKELRRRTASHNVKRVPKRLRARAGREMREDNTPTVNVKTRKKTGKMRLRLETAKRLRALGARRRAAKEDTVKVTPVGQDGDKPADSAKDAVKDSNTVVKTRTPRIKKSTLALPPIPKAKFRKRQRSKAWLPTHLFHAKRAHMTPPSAPLWRFALPLTPTAKSYRPTHRASNERGAVAWDTSYVSTIGLEGWETCLAGLLRAMGVAEDVLSGTKGEKWRRGSRSLETWLKEREDPKGGIAPATLLWCASAVGPPTYAEPDGCKRKLFIRVHPSAFLQVWEEVVRLAKVQKPVVLVDDLRFDLGSVEITGPGSTEALLGALWPSLPPPTEGDEVVVHDVVAETFSRLNGITNPAALPANTVLSLDVQDPRLHHPPRTVKPPTPEQQNTLLDLLANWPLDAQPPPAAIFNRKARTIASVALPSQKAINRRKALASPGQYPEPSAKDPHIPILLYTGTGASIRDIDVLRKHGRSLQAVWTLLLPWKAVQPVWYSLLYYPLSTGGQVRFGGLREKRQIAFEHGLPWFPGDFPGTKAGDQWEAGERERRRKEWEARPKGKRVSWEAVDVGGGRKGEVGVGWACDWERLLAGPPKKEAEEQQAAEGDIAATDLTGSTAKQSGEPTGGDNMVDPPSPEAVTGTKTDDTTTVSSRKIATLPPKPHQLSPTQAHKLLNSTSILPENLDTALAVVRITLVTRGVPQSCGRMYRLPTPTTQPDLRKQWLALLPANNPNKTKRHALPKLPQSAPSHDVQRRLAQSLLEPLRPGKDGYPSCPGEEDLIGFVTTGNFNLGEGQGTGIGSLLIAKVVEKARRDEREGRLCVVRNAGESVARLARWEVA